MAVYELGKFLGWFTGLVFGLALLNFFMKRFHKGIIVPLAPKRPRLAEKSKFLMQWLIRNHRWFGIAAVLSVSGHLIILWINYGLSLTGIIAMGLLVVLAGLGAWGHYRRGKRPGHWLTAHRSGAMVLVVLIFAHLLYKA